MNITPNIGLQIPPAGSNNWNIPLNYDLQQLDRLLSGNAPLTGLLVNGDVTVNGTITANAFSGLDGSVFLTSALFGQPNGIPQLNAGGKIPSSLLPTSGVVLVAFSATPIFDARDGQEFKMTLTGNVTSSTFANGAQGSAIVVFRFVQDATGGRTFVWPANVRNGGDLNPVPNARSVQAFAIDADGSLDAITPMMYS